MDSERIHCSLATGNLQSNDTDIAQKFIELDRLLKLSIFVIFNKIFQKPSVKGTLRYQKINFSTTSASSNFIN
jgi:hypothetical protein